MFDCLPVTLVGQDHENSESGECATMETKYGVLDQWCG